jgi:PAS domain S-box-containing protein
MLRQSEERLALAQRTGRIGVFDWDIVHCKGFWTPEMQEILGVPPDTEASYENWAKRVLPEDLPHLEGFLQEWLHSARAEAQWEYRIVRPDGEVRWIAASAHLVRQAAGQALRMIGTNQDITERKQAEEALRKRELILAQAGQMAHLGAWDVEIYHPEDLTANPLTWSDEVYRIFGYPPGTVRVTPQFFFQHVHPADRQAVLESSVQAMAHKQPYSIEHRILRHDGTERRVQEHAEFVFDEQGRPLRMVGAVQDITESKRLEEALRQSEERHRTLTEAMPQLAWTALPDGTTDYASSQWETYTGRPVAEVLEERWLQLVHPEDRERAVAAWQQAVRTGVVHDCDLRLRGADGRYRWFKSRGVPLRNQDGVIVKWFGTCTDISEVLQAREILARHNEELNRLVEERTTKLQEMVGELQHLSYTLAHDLRAPLRSLAGFTRLLEHECAGCTQPRSRDFYERIITSAERLDQLITDALNYTKVVRQDLPLREVQLVPLLRGIMATYPNLQPFTEQIQIAEDVPPVLGNESLLTQCFSNLLGNAVKFVAPGVAPQVRLWAERKPGRVRIWVEDNGIGIPAESQRSIFDLFQRLHTGYEGTGLGLAIVRKAAERMNGKVGVESEPGQGSRFWVELKAAD